MFILGTGLAAAHPWTEERAFTLNLLRGFWIWQDVYGINDSRWNQALASHWQTVLHDVVYSTPPHERDSNSLVVIDTDCTGSCKSNYHTFMTITAPDLIGQCKSNYHIITVRTGHCLQWIYSPLINQSKKHLVLFIYQPQTTLNFINCDK